MHDTQHWVAVEETLRTWPGQCAGPLDIRPPLRRQVPEASVKGETKCTGTWLLERWSQHPGKQVTEQLGNTKSSEGKGKMLFRKQ